MTTTFYFLIKLKSIENKETILELKQIYQYYVIY